MWIGFPFLILQTQHEGSYVCDIGFIFMHCLLFALCPNSDVSMIYTCTWVSCYFGSGDACLNNTGQMECGTFKWCFQLQKSRGWQIMSLS